MNYPVRFSPVGFAPARFAHVPSPFLEHGETRQWGGLAARRIRASPGRHDGGADSAHRLLFYLTGGVTAECASEGLRQRRVLTPADFDMIPAGASGSWEDDEATDMVAVRLAPDLVSQTAEALEIRGSAALAPKLGARDPLIQHLVGAVMAELDAPAPAGRLYADSLASALAVRLLHDFGPRAPARQVLSKPQLRRIVEYVETRLDGELTLAEIARVAGISVPHLTSLFRRTMGQSVHAYVMERRVLRARALILDRRTSVAEAALESGFAHQSHLARWMRRLLGMKPGQLLRS